MDIIKKWPSSSSSTRKQDDQVLEKIEVVDQKEEDDDDVALPGFRFHPTDEELVGFYLRRKVQKKPISLELIKQIDIYKHDPWDLPKASNVGDKEWYFFCKRGRKYRNSIRPNRVTGSGFWKATGIDRPIYSANGSNDCIGLKKSLVYYRGSAGKGTKTDWMMHEFRLPPSNAHNKTNNKHNIIVMDDKTIAQEAEVWTLCRILKRSVSTHRKCVPDWREMAAAKRNVSRAFDHEASSKTCSADSDNYNLHQSTNYISFAQGLVEVQEIEKKPFSHHDQYRNDHVMTMNKINGTMTTMNDNHLQALQYNFTGHLDHPLSSMSTSPHQNPSTASCSSFSHNIDVNEFLKHGNWDELRSVVEFAAGDPTFFM